MWEITNWNRVLSRWTWKELCWNSQIGTVFQVVGHGRNSLGNHKLEQCFKSMDMEGTVVFWFEAGRSGVLM